MKRRLLVVLLLVVAGARAVPAAGAVTPDDAAAVAADTGLFVEDGLAVERDAVADAVREASNAGLRLAVVLLAEDPETGAATFADAVLDRIGEGTVLVLSATGEGAASLVFERSVLQRALDAAFDAGGGDAGYVTAFADVLLGEGSGGAGGGAGGIVLLVIVGALVLVVWWAIARQKRASQARRQQAVAEARREIEAQLSAMADTILEISDRVAVSASREDNTFLQQASATFTETSDAFEMALDLAALERISDRLDEARWELDAAEAIADGEPVPERPEAEERHACFFDPTHAGPFEDARIRTAAGERTVKVCAADAERLRRGRDPQPRMIEVEGRQTPAPMAPRSHGGGGLDLGAAFSVILGGAAGRSFDWGGGGRRSRGGVSGGGARSSSRGTSSTGRRRTRSRAGRSRRRRR